MWNVNGQQTDYERKVLAKVQPDFKSGELKKYI